MTTKAKFLEVALAQRDKRVTVPTNPYGGQCVAYIDWLLQYAGLFNYNFGYVNAIDCLSRASSLGLPVTYANGSKPPVGSICVYDCRPYHVYGHIGVCVQHDADGSLTMLEQNVDGNADALENGGWVRLLNRGLQPNGVMTYNNISAPSQTLLGWFELPLASVAPAKPKVQESNLLLLS